MDDRAFVNDPTSVQNGSGKDRPPSDSELPKLTSAPVNERFGLLTGQLTGAIGFRGSLGGYTSLIRMDLTALAAENSPIREISPIEIPTSPLFSVICEWHPACTYVGRSCS